MALSRLRRVVTAVVWGVAALAAAGDGDRAPTVATEAAGRPSAGGDVKDDEVATLAAAVTSESDGGDEQEVDRDGLPDRWLFDSLGEPVGFARGGEVYTRDGVWMGSLDRHEVVRDDQYRAEILLGDRLVCNRFRARAEAPVPSQRDTDRLPTLPGGGRGRIGLPAGFADLKLKRTPQVASPRPPSGGAGSGPSPS